MHKTEVFYADVQFNLLTEVMKCFKQDLPLPAHIMQGYQIQKEPVYFYNQQTFWDSCLIEVQKILSYIKYLLQQLKTCRGNAKPLQYKASSVSLSTEETTS